MSYELFKGLSHVGIPDDSVKIVTFLQVISTIKNTYQNFRVDKQSNIYIPKVSTQSKKSKFTEMCNKGEIAVCARDDKFGKLILEMARVVIDNNYDRVEKYRSMLRKFDEDKSSKYPNCPPYFGNYQFKTLLNVIQILWSGGNGDGYVDYKLDEDFPSYLYHEYNQNNIIILNMDTIFQMFINEFKKRVQIKYIDNDELIDKCVNFKDEVTNEVSYEEKDVIDIITNGITSIIQTVISVIVPN